MTEPYLLTAPALLVLLLVATCDDLVEQRIPNSLVASGIALALAIGALHGGTTGVSWALAGMLLGATILLPFYLLGGMAAGDVKLMAMAGGFLGPSAVILAAGISLAMGCILGISVLALFRALRTDTAQRLARKIEPVVPTKRLLAPIADQRPTHIPYALAIAVGSLTALWWPAA